jgi:hypothetical protein
MWSENFHFPKVRKMRISECSQALGLRPQKFLLSLRSETGLLVERRLDHAGPDVANRSIHRPPCGLNAELFVTLLGKMMRHRSKPLHLVVDRRSPTTAQQHNLREVAVLLDDLRWLVRSPVLGPLTRSVAVVSLSGRSITA